MEQVLLLAVKVPAEFLADRPAETQSQLLHGACSKSPPDCSHLHAGEHCLLRVRWRARGSERDARPQCLLRDYVSCDHHGRHNFRCSAAVRIAVGSDAGLRARKRGGLDPMADGPSRNLRTERVRSAVWIGAADYGFQSLRGYALLSSWLRLDAALRSPPPNGLKRVTELYLTRRGLTPWTSGAKHRSSATVSGRALLARPDGASEVTRFRAML